MENNHSVKYRPISIWRVIFGCNLLFSTTGAADFQRINSYFINLPALCISTKKHHHHETRQNLGSLFGE